MTKESKEKAPVVNGYVGSPEPKVKSVVKLEADKMTITELREFGVAVTEFLEKSTLKEQIEKTGLSSGQVNIIDTLIHLPKIILSSDENITEFAKVVLIATGIDITSKNATEALDAINDTLELINKVNLFPFFYKAAMTFMNMIKG